MRVRPWMRTVHLVGAGCLGTLVYSPWIANDTFLLFNQVIIVPALAGTGLWMWLGHKIRKPAKGKT